MTEKLRTKLVDKGYRYIIRVTKVDFAVTKAEQPFKDSDDFDIYTCNQNESLNPLQIGKPYLLTETL